MMFIRFVIISTLWVALCAPGDLHARALELVSGQLRDAHRFHFVGHYAENEKGSYAEEGLEGTLRKPDRQKDAVRSPPPDVGLTPGEVAWMENHPVVRVASMRNWAPLDFVEAGEPAGFSVDYLRMVGEKVGLTFDFVFGDTRDALLAMGRNKELDLLPGISPTPGEEADFVFTRPYLINNPWEVFARTGEEPVRHIGDLAGKTIAVNRGGAQFTYLKENHPEIKLVPVENLAEGFEAVVTFYADGYLTCMLNGTDFIARNLLSGIEPIGRIRGIPILGNAPLHLAVRNDWPDLAAILAKGMDAVTMEEFNQLARKWLAPEVAQQVPLTIAERRWLRNHPVITLGTDATWAPFVVQRPEGTWDGLDVDFIDYINRAVGANIQITTGKWSEMVSLAKMRKIDGLSSSSAAPDRRAHFLFTDSYVTEYTLLLVRTDDGIVINSLDDLKGKTIIYQEGNAFAESVLEDLEGIEKIPVPSESAGVKMLVEGKGDACMSGMTYYTDYHAKFAGAVRVGWWFDDRPLHIVFSIRKDWPQLVSIINKALAVMPQEQKEAFHRQWIGMGKEKFPGRKRLNLSMPEMAWFQEHPKIRLGFSPHMEPLVIPGEDGTYSGALVALLYRLEEITGLNIEMDIGKWEAVIEKARSGELDGLASSSPALAEALKMHQTRPFYHAFVKAFAKRGRKITIEKIEDLKGRTIVYMDGIKLIEKILEPIRDACTIVKVDDVLEALAMLEEEKADVFLGFHHDSYMIRKYLMTDVKPVYSFLQATPVAMGVAVRADRPELVSILNKGITALGEKEINDILGRWMDPSGPEKQIVLTDEETLWLKEHPVITLGGGVLPPFDFVDATGRTAGVGPDYTDLLGEMLGISFEYVSGEWADIFEMVKRKEIDGIRLLTGDETRARYLNFTKPYMSLEYGVFIPRGGDPVTSLRGLSWKKVGVLKDSYSANYLARNYPEILVEPFPTYREALRALVNGELDAVVGLLAGINHVMGLSFIRRVKMAVKLPEMAENLHIGVRKDWPELVAILNKGLNVMPEEIRRQVSQRWFSLKVAEEEPGRFLTSEEIRWLSGQKEIPFWVDPAWAPYDFIDEGGEHAGVVSDIVQGVSRALGLPLKPVSGWTRAQALQSLEQREVGFIAAVARTPELEKKVLFTTPYLELPLALITREALHFVGDLSRMKGARIAVVRGAAVQEYLTRDHPGIEIVECGDMREVLDAVSKGRADALIDAYAVAEYARKQLRFANLRVTAATPYTLEICMAVREDWPELVHILNKKLGDITESEKATMLETWMAVQEEQSVGRFIVGLVVLGGVLAGGMILGAIFYRRRRLSR